MGGRVRVAWVWCACWARCKGIGVPGWVGAGGELCEACEDEAKRAEVAADREGKAAA